MRTVIIVSKCIKVVKQDLYHFHFRGVCQGEALKKVILTGKGSRIEKGQEYLMYVQLVSCEQGVLRGNILKLKPLEECWDKL